ncbi:MAG: peptidylprolyl isomerase [Anaerolineales bacterium]|nr:peptidylprolyl isomerase [Anaerolineales bacterium]
MRRNLNVPDSQSILLGDQYANLRAPDHARLNKLCPGLMYDHNPFIRRIILCTRAQLENQIDPETNEPLLKPIKVELLGEEQRDAILLPPYLREAYDLAEKFCAALGKRMKGSGFLKTLLLRRVGGSISQTNHSKIIDFTIKEVQIMSNKKRSMRSTQRSTKTHLKVNTRVVAVTILVLVIVAVVWVFISAQKPAKNAAESTGQMPASAGAKQYASAPPMGIDKSKQYTATVKMAKGGEFVIQLYADKAPITVNSFVYLAQQGFFDGVTFHRVLEGFMAQGGDPTGTGGGGPGYEFANEDSDLKFDQSGVVAMANAGRDTNGSQFFITFGPTEQLNGGYTIFGQVISSMDVVNGIKRRDPDQNPTYPGDAIESITITEQ